MRLMGRMVAFNHAAVLFIVVLVSWTTSDAFLFSRPSSQRREAGALRQRRPIVSPQERKVCLAPRGKVRASMVDAEGKGESSGRVSRVWKRYLCALEKRPLVTKWMSSGVISGTANVIEQTTSPGAFSLAHWAAFTLVGAFFVSTTLHYWYIVLERVANSKLVASRVRSKWGRALVQVGLDQTLGASFINSGYFAIQTVLLAVLTGTVFPLPELGSSIWDKVTSRYVTMIINNAKVWPWVGCINFWLVPRDLRVLVSNFVAVFWDYLMSKWCR